MQIRKNTDIWENASAKALTLVLLLLRLPEPAYDAAEHKFKTAGLPLGKEM